ncbi:MAG: hypothetical protein ACK4RX_01445 [Chitinophagaceae bacterium]
MSNTNDLLDTENSWNKAYWFSRMLINKDKYVAVGKENKLLATIASSLRVIKSNNPVSPETLILEKQTLKNIIEDRYKKTSTTNARVQTLLRELDEMILTQEDMDVFILTCENIMIPLNDAISNIPSDDKEYTEIIARSYLDTKGEDGLATIINLWDDLGVKGCLTAERTQIVRAFSILRLLLSKSNSTSEEDRDIVLSGFTQEFERRAGQKRKKRAGGSLEDVTAFILDYFKIKRAPSPDHFQADIEVDNWVKTKDGWLIGISCKRTLRERWKQVSSAESSVLSRYKIKHIYHVITFDEDLSDDKLTLLGGLRHIFYLPDANRKYKYAKEHVGLKDYVRPISELIKDLKKEIF